MRECGPCTVCCDILPINEPGNIIKHQYEPCKHKKTVGAGCKIYGQPLRPLVCNRFSCGWRAIDSIPERLRPDISGVMITMAGGQVCEVYIDPIKLGLYHLDSGHTMLSEMDKDIQKLLEELLVKRRVIIRTPNGERFEIPRIR